MPHSSALLRVPLGLAPCWLVSLTGACKFAKLAVVLPRPSRRARPSSLCAVAASRVVPCRSLPSFSVFACSHSGALSGPLPIVFVSPCACCILCVCCALRLCCSSSLSPLTPPLSVSRAAPFASLVTAARPRLGPARGSSVARCVPCVLCVCRASSRFLYLLLFASPSLLPAFAAGAPSPSLLPAVAAGAPAHSSCVPLCGCSSRARLCSPATCGSLCWSLAGAGCCWCVGRASAVATLWVSSCASTSTCARRRVSRADAALRGPGRDYAARRNESNAPCIDRLQVRGALTRLSLRIRSDRVKHGLKMRKNEKADKRSVPVPRQRLFSAVTTVGSRVALIV